MKTDVSLFKFVSDFFHIHLPQARMSSINTIRAYQNSLKQFLDYIKEENSVPFNKITTTMINYQSITGFISSLKNRGCANTTSNLRLQAIRTFVNFAAMSAPEFVVIQSSLRSIKKLTDQKIKTVSYMSEAAIKSLLEAPLRTTKKGLRDFMIMTLLYDTGARIQEILSICISDLNLAGTPKVMLKGKGNKIRYVPLMKITVDHINNYVKIFHGMSYKPSDYLFYILRDGKKKRITEDNIRKQIVPYAIVARAKNSEVPLHVHPHMLRHSRAMHLYQNGMPLPLISQWLGHSDFETTLIYAYADTEMKRKAIEAATPNDSPLKNRLNSTSYRVTDEQTLKKLCGLV